MLYNIIQCKNYKMRSNNIMIKQVQWDKIMLDQ